MKGVKMSSFRKVIQIMCIDGRGHATMALKTPGISFSTVSEAEVYIYEVLSPVPSMLGDLTYTIKTFYTTIKEPVVP